MSSREQNFSQPVRERSVGVFAFIVFGLFMVLGGAILAFYFVPNPDLLFKQFAEQASEKKTRHLVFEDAEFVVPNNMVARVSRRPLGSIRQIDLQVPWPYKPGKEIDRPELADDLGKFIFVTLEPAGERISPRALLDRTYRYFQAGKPQSVVTGLTYYAFKPGSPYADLQVFTGKRGNKEIILACTGKPSALGPLLCERRYDITGKIAVRYRYDRNMLVNWSNIDAGVEALLASILHRRKPG